MKIEYKIQTEDINREKILRIVRNIFSGFSVQVQLGYWDKIQENSICIIVIANREDRDAIFNIAKGIKDLNNQESVLVTEQEIRSVLIQ